VIRLSKKAEYGLLAIAYLYGRPATTITSVKDISSHFAIPPAILAKVMQALKRQQIVRSVKGMSGGYALCANLAEVSFLDFLGVFNEDTALVGCLSGDEPGCQQAECCAIRDPIGALNDIIQNQLRAISLAQVLGTPRDVVPLASIGPH